MVATKQLSSCARLPRCRARTRPFLWNKGFYLLVSCGDCITYSIDAGLCNRHLLMCCLATISTLSLASEVCLLIGHQQKLQLSTNNFPLTTSTIFLFGEKAWCHRTHKNLVLSALFAWTVGFALPPCKVATLCPIRQMELVPDICRRAVQCTVIIDVSACSVCFFIFFNVFSIYIQSWKLQD